jgi:hypothetical protein
VKISAVLTVFFFGGTLPSSRPYGPTWLWYVGRCVMPRVSKLFVAAVVAALAEVHSPGAARATTLDITITFEPNTVNTYSYSFDISQTPTLTPCPSCAPTVFEVVVSDVSYNGGPATGTDTLYYDTDPGYNANYAVKDGLACPDGCVGYPTPTLFSGTTLATGTSSLFTYSTNYAVTYTATAVTPLPLTFPLFATGLGVMGLLGWRRKRKAQAAAA